MSKDHNTEAIVLENARQEEYLQRHIDVFCQEFEERLEFIIPMPYVSLSPNARTHHMDKCLKAREFRNLVYIYAKRALAGQPRFKRVVIHYRLINTGVRPRLLDVGFSESETKFYVPRDKDNARASLKSAQDGIADALLSGHADDYDIVESGYIAIIKEPKKRDRERGPFPVYSHIEVVIQGTRFGKESPAAGKGRKRTPVGASVERLAGARRKQKPRGPSPGAWTSSVRYRKEGS